LSIFTWLAGGGLIVGGVLTGNPDLVVAGIGLTLQGVGDMFSRGGVGGTPKVGLSRRHTLALSGNRSNPEAPVPLVYGTAKVGAIIVDYRIDTASPNDLYMPAVLCVGSRDGEGIGGVADIWYDDQLAYNSAGTIQSPFTTSTSNITKVLGAADVDWRDTDVDGTSLADVNSTDWITTDEGAGLAGVLFKLTLDTDIYSNVPVITAKVKGNFVEDHRSEVSGVDLTFADADPDTIVRASGSFVTDGYVAGDRVAVTGTSSNNGIYTIATVAALTLTLVAADVLAAEGPDDSGVLKRWAHPDNGGDNPALCIRDYLLSDVYGPGLSETDLDETSFGAMADYCDETVDIPSSTQNRYTCNGWLDTSRPMQNVLDELLTSCRGNLVLQGGTYRLFITGYGSKAGVGVTLVDADPDTIAIDEGSFLAHGFTAAESVIVSESTADDGTYLIGTVAAQLLTLDAGEALTGQALSTAIDLVRKSHTFALTEDNIVGDWEFSDAGAASKINRVRATFIDPLKSYTSNEIQYPNPGDANAYLTADNSWLNELEFDLPMTNNVYMAEQIAMIRLQESRWGVTCGVTCFQEALQLQVGDVVPVTHTTPGWTAKLFTVLGVSILPNTLVRLLLREFDADAYSHTAHNTAGTEPSTDLPDHKDFIQLFSCSIHHDSDTGIGVSGSAQYWACDNELEDTSSMHDTSTNNSRITIPTGGAGRYSVKAHVYLGADTYNPARGKSFAFIVNRSTVYGHLEFDSGEVGMKVMAAEINLADGDYVELQYGAPSGGTGTCNILSNSVGNETRFWIARRRR
jgi:hypothetical protein